MDPAMHPKVLRRNYLEAHGRAAGQGAREGPPSRRSGPAALAARRLGGGRGGRGVDPRGSR
eukprot:1431167-Alexandrium_andersonii.AAC.1